jgi:hypothetical protein
MALKTHVTQSTQSDVGKAVEELTASLKQIGLPVRGGVVYCTIELPTEELQPALKRALGDVPFIGCTSCLGVGSSARFLGNGKPAVAALWLLGEGVRFGTALLSKAAQQAEHVGAKLARTAMSTAGMAASDVRFAIFHATPGDEEAALRGISGELSAGVPLIGGTAADNDLSAKWSLFTEKGISTDGFALAVCNWPGKLAAAYRGGYLLAGPKGKVTRSSGRVVQEIDGRPAAAVYNEWIRGAIAAQLESGGAILRESTLNPLGVARARLGNLDLHLLVHPERVVSTEKSLHLFAEVKEGEVVHLMRSSPTALVRRASAVAEEALRRSKVTRGEIDAALMIYCGGCLLAIPDQAERMLADFGQAVAQAAALSAFTFGEQGCIVPERIDHGNLMCCVLLLACTPA